MKHLPPQFLVPVPLPTPFRPGGPRPLDPLGLHIRDTSDPHKVRDLLVAIDVLRRDGEAYVPYLPMKADLVNGKVPASQLPEDRQGVTEVLVDGVSVVTGGTASIDLTGKVDKEAGKGLSSNDYTTEEKTKLANVEAGAQKNVTPTVPSTDASAAGKPADAKATGDQLVAKLSKTEAAATYATQTALSNVAGEAQDAYNTADAALNGLSNLADVARTGSYNDLVDKPTIPTIPVQSVNGQTGAVVLDAMNIPMSYGAPSTIIDIMNQIADALSYAQGATITASAQLADRTGNRVVPLATNTENIVLTFPDAVAGYLRDFLVLVTNTSGNTGSITFTPPTGAVVYGDGFTNSPAIGETWLYSVTEVAANVFWAKSAKMEVAQ